jgi:threonine dehydratase
MTNQVTLDDIRRAAARIKATARRTPLERSRWLSDELDAEVWLKLECLQRTGSFKLRGAMARLSQLSDEERARGVLTVSAGNHGLGVAYCAEALNLDARIVVPRSASPAKIAAIRRYGVTLIECGETYDEAERAARRMETESGATFVSPYNDAAVIAGQGTVALELLEDAPDLDAIVVPVGGGGLIAGVAIAAKAIRPQIKIYGAEPATTATMTAALAAGRIIEISEEETIADGLAGNIEPGSMTFPIVRDLVDDMMVVDEAALRRAVARVAREDHLMIEGSAAVSVAALSDVRLRGQRVAAIVSGRNITLDLFARVTAENR